MTSRRTVHPETDYTPDDVKIWRTVCPTIRHLLTWSRYSDGRDADIMLTGVSHPRAFWTWLVPNPQHEGVLLRWRGVAPIVVRTYRDPESLP